MTMIFDRSAASSYLNTIRGDRGQHVGEQSMFAAWTYFNTIRGDQGHHVRGQSTVVKCTSASATEPLNGPSWTCF